MSNTIDNNFNCAARFHGTDADGSTAGDDVAWFKGHVMGDHADQFEWTENHVGNRIILAFLIVQNGFDNQFVRIIDTGNNAGPNEPKVSKPFARVHCAKVGSFWISWPAVTSLEQV